MFKNLLQVVVVVLLTPQSLVQAQSTQQQQQTSSNNNNNNNVTESLMNAATQYDDAFLSAPYPDGFGIPLKAQAVLNVTYSNGPVTLGKNLTAEDTKTQPTITIIPSNVTAFKAPNVFTLVLADANALGNPDKEGNYRHFLENGVTFGDPTNEGAMAMNVGSGTVVTPYAGPGPLLNTGPHRYAWMVFSQPSNFHAPSNLSTAGVGPGHWFLNSYVSSSGLGDLVAANFFIVQNGPTTFPHNGTVTHLSTPSSGTNNNNNNNSTSGQSGSSSSSGSSKDGAKSDADGPVWKDCAGIIKSLVMALGVAVSGYILVQ